MSLLLLSVLIIIYAFITSRYLGKLRINSFYLEFLFGVRDTAVINSECDVRLQNVVSTSEAMVECIYFIL